MATKSVVLNDRTYILSKLNAFEQLHIAQPLITIFSALNGKNKEADASAFLEKIGSLEKETIDNIIMSLLKNTKVKLPNDTGLAYLFSDGQLMYDDLEMYDLLMLCYEAFKFNFENFLPKIQALLQRLNVQNAS